MTMNTLTHKQTHTIKALGTALLLANTIPTGAEEFEDPGDHPFIPRISGSEMITYQTSELVQITLPLGAHSRSDGWEDSVDLEGRHSAYTYILRDPEATTLMVKRAYRQALENNGFEILWSGSGRDELGRAFRTQEIFNRPRADGDTRRANRAADRELRYLAVKHEDEGVHASLLMYQNRDLKPIVVLDVVEDHEAELEVELVPANPEAAHEADLRRLAENPDRLSTTDMEARLMRDGRVAVRDILFEFDSDDIVPASADALSTIGALMEESPGLKLLVVGHTDAVGDFQYNLELSMARALSVTNWLQEEHEIPSSRLQAAGAGMMAPAATNRTDEGRAQNRRVELVEITQ